MRAVATRAAVSVKDPGVPGYGRRPRHRCRWMAAAAAAVVAVVAVAVVLVFARPFAGAGGKGGGVSDNNYPTSLATVTRQTLTSQVSVPGTLGYARSYNVVNQAQGVITGLPVAGSVIRQGGVLYRMSGSPVVLLYGAVPAYRDLVQGITGADVRQLNHDLVTLGYATSSQLDPSADYYSAETAVAVEGLQQHLGVTQTGSLVLGRAVFLPSAIRVTAAVAILGTSAVPGPVLSATSTSRQVTISLDPADQRYVKTGDRVSVVLPGNVATPGRVSSVAKVATMPAPGGGPGASSPTITVDVILLHPRATGNLDQAPVQVSITTSTVRNALVVPVNALLALANGGYAVEEVTPAGVHHLVRVALGLFDDAAGAVQVTGSGLAAGQRVVVPGP